MFQEPDYQENLSLMLSEVLHDIGVNKSMVMRRRKGFMLRESMSNIMYRLIGINVTLYQLGSQSEGTTTIGLASDMDVLGCMHDFNIIQDRSEWEHGKENYLMIQDENTTPGYCFLQLFRDDEPFPASDIPDERYIIDKNGRILLKNTMLHGSVPSAEEHGPSLATHGQPGYCDRDTVLALPCKSWPQSASSRLERQSLGRRDTQWIRKHATGHGCFVVPTGSKVSKYPELEWRISSCLAEKWLMLNLNITQIKCYVLLKMILKSFLNPQGDINISSFMCKTVLLHCIEKAEPRIWKEDHLFTCLTHCLLKLRSCIQDEKCSHFIIQENNLFAGQFTAETKQQLLKNLTNFNKTDGQSLLRINIDDLGNRLQVKLNKVPKVANRFQSSLQIHESNMTNEYFNIADQFSDFHGFILKYFHNKQAVTMKQSIDELMTIYDNGNLLEQASCKFVIPFVLSTYGSVLASASIADNNRVSTEALFWLTSGLNSDISSSRLKLASVYYSSGYMEKAELILRLIERQCHSYPVVSICACWEKPSQPVKAEFMRVCSEQSEDCIKHITAFCVRFIQKELKCVPHELQYEMFRSTKDDMIHRHEIEDCWMDWAVIDSLPFLYFLQFKIYGHLQRYQDQRQALNKLNRIIVTGENLGHRETALNVLGECMEQVNRPQQALKCYLLSIQQRARNNVAKHHICKLLSRLLVRQ